MLRVGLQFLAIVFLDQQGDGSMAEEVPAGGWHAGCVDYGAFLEGYKAEVLSALLDRG